jgi:hypothetical protein
MAKKPPISKRYFAQVGTELLEVDPEHVGLHGEGASFSTSAPVLFYQVKAIVGDPDKGPSTTLIGVGPTWKDAEKSIADQLPKENE